MNLSSESHAGQEWRLVILAPNSADVPHSFRYRLTDAGTHGSLLQTMQRFRGQVYLGDGAIQPWELTADGRQNLAVDYYSWHILGLDREDRVRGCARYLSHGAGVSFIHLGAARSALAQSDEWRDYLCAAVEDEIALAGERGMSFVEVGGWALDASVRNSLAALQIALSTYALASILGGCIGIGTVTQRHGSSSILRRIGGSSLVYDSQELPTYFDARYGCQMEILRFDSMAPNPRYTGWVDKLKETLLSVPVLSRSRLPRGTRQRPEAVKVAVPAHAHEDTAKMAIPT